MSFNSEAVNKGEYTLVYLIRGYNIIKMSFCQEYIVAFLGDYIAAVRRKLLII